MSEFSAKQCIRCGIQHWRREPGLPFGLVPLSPLTPRKGDRSPLCYRCASHERSKVKDYLRREREGRT